jgi:hypothetical protein
VGAIALMHGEEPFTAIEPAALEEIARGIYDAADVHTVFLGGAAPASSAPRPRTSQSVPPPSRVSRDRSDAPLSHRGRG